MVKTELDGIPLSRKRKLDDTEELISDAPSSVAPPAKKKGGRQKKVGTGDDAAKPPRKRGPRKPKTTTPSGPNSKLPSEEPQPLYRQLPQQPYLNRSSPHEPPLTGSIVFSLDATPVPSAPPSPTLTSATGPFWPLDDPIPPLKKPKRIDQGQAAKRVVALEEAQRRVWLNIARKDIVRVCISYYAFNGVMTSCTGLQVPLARLRSQGRAP